MHSWQRPSRRLRPAAALLTLAAHALLLLLVLHGREPAHEARPARELVSLPITLFTLPPAPPLEEEAPVPAPAPRPRVPAPELPRPATAITLAPVEEPAPLDAPPRHVDWHSQAGELAARMAEEMDQPPPTLGKPLQKMREPCRPPGSSFRWKEDSPGTGGIAALTPGWEKPEADKHLFDDMMAGRRQKSSVPAANECD